MTYEITLVKGLYKKKPNQIKTAHALGLHRIGQTVIKEENDAIRGMLVTIAHLVKIVEK